MSKLLITMVSMTMVYISGRRLTLTVGSSAYTLVHTGKSKITVVGQGQRQKDSEQFNFKITGKPDAIIRFTVYEGELRELFYAEQKDGEMIFATAFRKP